MVGFMPWDFLIFRFDAIANRDLFFQVLALFGQGGSAIKVSSSDGHLEYFWHLLDHSRNSSHLWMQFDSMLD